MRTAVAAWIHGVFDGYGHLVQAYELLDDGRVRFTRLDRSQPPVDGKKVAYFDDRSCSHPPVLLPLP